MSPRVGKINGLIMTTAKHNVLHAYLSDVRTIMLQLATAKLNVLCA